MRFLYKLFLILFTLMVISSAAFAVNEAAQWNWKDVKIGLEGDYQMFGKYFNERDINSYDGNLKPKYNISPPPTNEIAALPPDQGGPTNGQTDKIEAWLENELFLVPSIAFSDKLTFQARIDIDYLIFDSDNNTKVLYEPIDSGSGYTLLSTKKADQTIRLTEAFVQMITPVGLFVAGRFNDGSNGIVWAAQFDEALPGWTFAVAWNKKAEQKYYYEDPDVPYYDPNTRNGDYLDRDDMDEIRVVTIYEKPDKTIKSEQWLDFRLGYSKSAATNMRICLPQWKFNYNKGNIHYFHYLGTGMGTLAEITKGPIGDDLQALMDNGNQLAPPGYSYPNYEPGSEHYLPIKDMGPVEGKVGIALFDVAYDIGKVTPFASAVYTTGISHWTEINGFLWDEYNPKGYRTPSYLNVILLGEVEDKYFNALVNIATKEAFDQNDICFNNMTLGRLGAKYHFTDKWEFMGQAVVAWRSNIKYFEDEYWSSFPVNYALWFKYTDSNGHEIVPFLFMKDNVQYKTNVSPYLGTELTGWLTYNLFPGLDVSLIGSYFFAGDFYQDTLTPKPYLVQWLDTTDPTSQAKTYTIYGPNLGADQFDLTNAWTVQFKIDFKFNINSNALAAVTSTEMQQK
jgi:hypothetical protein